MVDTIEVRAPRPALQELLDRGPTWATVVPLGHDVPASRDLSDLLDRTAGLHVHRYGGLGAFSQASVRGSSAGQVLICLDGVPVAAAGEGFVNLAHLPVSSFGHAEIYRGPQVAAFGGPPAAGVINLVTPPTAAVPLRLAAGGGSFGTTYARGFWGGARGALSGLITGQFRRSEGDWPYLNRNGTLFGNTSDDRTVRRANNDFRDYAGLGKLTLRWPTGPHRDRGHRNHSPVRLDYTVQRILRDGGVPGTENLQTQHVRFRTDRARHEVTLLGRTPFAGGAQVEAAYHRESIRDRYRNLEGEVGLSRADTEDRTKERGGRAGLVVRLDPLRQELRLKGESRTERWTPHDHLREIREFTRTRRHRTVSIEDRVNLGSLTLEGAYRWARAADNYAGPIGWGQPAEPSPERVLRHEAPAFGLRFDLGRGLVLKANRGKMGRFPSFPELFGQNGVQEGNPALRPETGVQWDAGVLWTPPGPIRLEAAYFESVFRDRITLLQNSQRTVKAMNLDRTWVRGVESTAYGRWRATTTLGFELQGSFTWQEARDVGRSPTYRGKELPNLPAREGYGSFACEWGGWTGRWELSARSAHYRDRYNSKTKRTPASNVHDLSLERRLVSGAVHLRGEVRNLFDRRIEDMDGFPLPGRMFLAELTWTR